MTRRFTKWTVLACMGALAACTSGDEGGPVGNTQLSVMVPQGDDIGTVEYTINCLGNSVTFLDGDDSFPDEVTLNGNLEVVDNRTNASNQPADPNVPPDFGTFRPADGAEVWQGFMDGPPGACTVELRARSATGEVICTAREGFTITAGSIAHVSVVLICSVSFQAEVGQFDIDGTFSFVVGNFCPDLFVLNCLESLPQDPPNGDPASTTCEVKYRDGDSTCGENCDPQTCIADPADPLAGLVCSGPDPGVSTLVDCQGAAMDCDGLGGMDDLTCSFAGDQLGTLATNAPIIGNPATFDVNCGLTNPGATVECHAWTTDGDIECDRHKIVSFTCPGLAPCDEDTAPVCDGSTELHPECVTGVCDDSTGTAVCVYTPIPGNDGTTPSDDCITNPGQPDGINGKCDNSFPDDELCQDFGCTFGDDTTCDDPNTQCLTNGVDACQMDGSCQPEIPENAGTFCDINFPTSTSDDSGQCDGTLADNCVSNCSTTDCSDTGPNAECTDDDVCDPTGNMGAVCDVANCCPATNPPIEDCSSCCDSGGGANSGDCNVGVCSPTPVLSEVCARFSPDPVVTTQNCNGQSEAQTCICEKAEFLAIDCELLGNSAPLPLNASAQQFNVATVNNPVTILPQDAIILAAPLICGFIGAGFQNALVADSTIVATYTNATVAADGTTDSLLSSFLANTTSMGALVSPHGDVFFSFGVACGDNCTGSPLTCQSSGDPCTLATFTDDCSVENGGNVGEGPGIVAPFFANAPGMLPPGPIPNQLVTLLPTGGTVDMGLPYGGIALNLPSVGGLASGCAGGNCSGVCTFGTCSTAGTSCIDAGECPMDETCEPIPCTASTQCTAEADGCEGVLCSTLVRGTETSPRVMYDNTCNKLGFAACGGTGCDTTADCPFNAADIGGFTPGQTCDTSAGGPPNPPGPDWLGVCTNVNTGSCGFVAPGVCPDGGTSCGSCTDANGNTGICNLSGAPCAGDLDCPFGLNDLCGPPTPCAVSTTCATGETCELSDDRCDPVIEALSGGLVPSCCAPFGDFTSTADICKDKLPPEDSANAPPCCDQTLPDDPTLPPVSQSKDEFCENPVNKASCCAAIGTDYPEATSAQNPQLPVNP